jgi:hypothetical protein
MLTEGLTFGNRLNHHCALTPTVLSKAGAPSIDQGFDCIGKFLFRIEEMVWFQKDTGLWGLGIIWKRWIPKEWLRSQNYVIRPLSHPFDNSHTEFTLDDTRLRPWLARSPPKYDAAYLQENPGLSYDQIDWLALSHECFRGLPGDHMLKEEAAIVAAKTIDATYTLVDQVKKTTKESYWDSMYLGAEKIYTGGDLIRLHDNQILAVDSIIERVQLQEARLRHSVLIVGDIYAHAVLPTSGDSRGCGPNTLLPYRLLNDITWCNNSLIRGKPGYWKLVATRHTVSIHQVKGRWYETSVLSPNLSISENSAYSDILKPRGHATAMERGIRRMGSRMTAFFDAIPHTDARATELPKDVDSPKRGPHSSSV